MPIHDIEHPSALHGFVTSNEEMLTKIQSQVQNIRGNLTELTESMKLVQVPPQEIEDAEGEESNKSELLTLSALLQELWPQQEFLSALKLYSDFRSPLYKNRPFK